MSDHPYEVGYRKPPRHTQFKKGQSGCPSGGRKAKKSPSDLLDKILSETVAVHEGGTKRRMTREEVLMRQLVNKAAAGDRQSTKLVLDCRARQQPEPDDGNNSSTDDFLMAELRQMLADEEGGHDHEPD